MMKTRATSTNASGNATKRSSRQHPRLPALHCTPRAHVLRLTGAACARRAPVDTILTLEAGPQVQLEIQRTETEIDERLLRRETKKDLVKAQYANAEAEKRAAKEAEDATKKSSMCILS